MNAAVGEFFSFYTSIYLIINNQLLLIALNSLLA